MNPLAHVEGFEWDDGNSHKPAKHGVTVKEAEEPFFDPRARIQEMIGKLCASFSGR